MNARTLLAAALISCLSCGTAQGQTVWTRIWKSLEVRQNTEVADYVAKSATAQVSLPDSGPTTTTVAIGVLVDLVPGASARLRLIGEYNRNTTIDKRQDDWQSGLKGEFLTGRILGALDPVIEASAQIAQDRVKGTTSLQASSSLTFTGDNHTSLPNTTIVLSSATPVNFVYSPYVGLEYESKVSGAGPSRFFRGALRLDLAIRFGQNSAPLLEFASTNTFRRDFADQSVAGENSNSFHTVSGTAYLPGVAERVRVGITMSRTWGEDPTKGFAHQAFTQVALAIRIKRAS